MSDFEYGGQQYSIGKLSAFKQLHVARRVAPILTGLADMAMASEGKKLDFKQAVEPMVIAVSKLSDEDTEMIIGTCLEVVSRKTSNKTMAPVFKDGNNMFDDLNMIDLLRLTAEVIKVNLGNTFGALLTAGQ